MERLAADWKALLPMQQWSGERVEFHASGDKADEKRRPAGPRLIARSKDGCQAVQLGEKDLVTNQLPPYPGWETLRAWTMQRFDEVGAILDRKSAMAVALRYINVFQFPEKKLSWSHWFHGQLPLPESLDDGLAGFHIQFQQIIHNAFMASIGLQRIEPSADNAAGCAIILNTEIKEGLGAGRWSFPERLDRLHEAHVTLFESYLRDTTRHLLDPVLDLEDVY